MVTLHRHKIVHMDIKPDNVMFSPTLNKLVFIDYGLSKIIDEEVGLKTLSTFQGTAQFLSREMMALLAKGNKAKGDIDLYFNELVGHQIDGLLIAQSIKRRSEDHICRTGGYIKYYNPKGHDTMSPLSINIKYSLI